MAVALVVIQVGERPFEIHRRAVGASNSGQRVVHGQVDFPRPFDVIANEQIEPAIVIVIDESRAGAPAGR